LLLGIGDARAQDLGGLWSSSLYRVELSIAEKKITGTFTALGGPQAPAGRITGELQPGGNVFIADWSYPDEAETSSFKTSLAFTANGLVLAGYRWAEGGEPTVFALHRAVNGELVSLPREEDTEVSLAQISPGPIPDVTAGGQPVRKKEIHRPATGGGGASAGGGGGPVLPRGGEPSTVLIGIGILTAGILVLTVLLVSRMKARTPAPQAAAVKIDVHIEVVGPSGAAQTVHFRRAPISVGRASDNDLVLDDQLVSRRHLEIRVEEGRMAIVDLGSSSGTVVDDRRVSISPVYAGSVVRVGQTSLRLL